MQASWPEVERRLFRQYPTGAIPRQDLPGVTGYKASYFARLAAEGKGPEFYHQGKLAMYPVRELVDWLRKRSYPRGTNEGDPGTT